MPAFDCTAVDSQIWAQSVDETDATAYSVLDPDGNGLACEHLSPGAAPALWTDQVPAEAVPATLASVTDGDTIRVLVNGQNEPVRLILIDTQETRDPNNPVECYGQEASGFLAWLLTVYAEQGAKSRADLPAGSRFGTHFLALDEFHQFVSQSGEALSGMMSQTRKFGMFVLLSHQTLDQIPETMRGALQNVEVEITFRTGREDAEHQAKVVGTVDPLTVKHVVEEGEERSHPTFYSLGEQWEGWTQQVTGLKKRFAFVRHPSGKVIKVQSPPMPDPVVAPERLAAVEERYLATCFAPAPAPTPVPIFEQAPAPFQARVRS